MKEIDTIEIERSFRSAVSKEFIWDTPYSLCTATYYYQEDCSQFVLHHLHLMKATVM